MLGPQLEGMTEPSLPGSNGFVVGGAIAPEALRSWPMTCILDCASRTTWYRARLLVDEGPGSPTLDITGVTLPGAPTVVAGSNGRVAGDLPTVMSTPATWLSSNRRTVTRTDTLRPRGRRS